MSHPDRPATPDTNIAQPGKGAPYRALFDAIDAAMFIIGIDNNRFIDMNQRAVDWLGYSRDALLEMTWGDIVGELARLEADCCAIKALPPGAHHTGDRMYRAKSGTLTPGQMSACRFTFGGEPAILCTVRELPRLGHGQSPVMIQRELADALRDAAAALNRTLRLDDVVGRLLPYIARVIPGQVANIMLREGDQLRLAAHCG